MVLYLIGLGLGSVEDITVKGLKTVKSCSKVYLESYTSILSYGYGVDKAKMEEFYGRELLEADREFVEQGCDNMIAESKGEDIALLVVGDPFGATTHADLVIRAKEQDVEVQIIHNTSILNAVGCCGLQLYSFGEVVSIVMWTETWKPESFYDKIAQNKERGLHTLCLLDIKVKEQTVENMIKGNKKYEPPRFLTCSQAAQQLLEILKHRKEHGHTLAFDEESTVVGLARVGWPDQLIKAMPLNKMAEYDMGSPLHSLVIPGHLHPLESRMLDLL
uniref:diphthine methyl ester synthase n=1 Tax=Bursaphelenchus xylophilus TaxID=6326 RepID=A0A1I7SW80_BURXY